MTPILCMDCPNKPCKHCISVYHKKLERNVLKVMNVSECLCVLEIEIK